MIKNYIKVAVRNLLKYKGFSFINIMGLAIGIACYLMILMFVQDEMSYDKYNDKYERIYRVTLSASLGNDEFKGAVTSAPVAEALLRNYPEIESAVRIQNFGFPVIRYNDKIFSEERFFWVDSSFFDVFSVEFVKGDAKTALKEPNTVVITESIARKYFGDEDPLNKSLSADKRRDYIVTGVIKDFPVNSHFHFDFLGSIASYDLSRVGWVDNNMYTYIVLKKGADAKALEGKLEDFVLRYVAPVIQSALGTSFEQLRAKGAYYNYKLQPLKDIHLKSDLSNEIEPNGNIQYVYIFSFIAVAILFIACINFINLSTARSSSRSKEIGIRKTLGAYRTYLIKQLLVETIVTTFIAVIFAIILIEIFLPAFNSLIGKSLQLSYFKNIQTIPLLILLTLGIGTLAGIYPAFYLSMFDPVKLFRKVSLKSSKSALRNTLVVLQFTISIILLIGTFIVYTQLQYIKNKRLGFDKEQILVIQKTDDILQYGKGFLEELRTVPGVIDASNSNTVFGRQFGNTAFKISEAAADESHIFWIMRTDHNIVNTYNIEMVQGRFYSKDFPSDIHDAVVINETAAKVLGIHGNAVGKNLVSQNPDFASRHIIGVIKDFHFESLHQPLRPLVMGLFNEEGFGRYVSVRLSPGNYQEKIEDIKSVWRKFAGPQDFEYYFLDDEFNRIYKAEQRTGVISTVFAALAIITACLGLLGLAAFTAEKRTKEIGIRKIMGASVPGIVFLLSKEFIKWVIVANLIAWPVSYLIMQKWLSDFAYRIDIPLWSFITAGVCALVIAFVTISYQAIKAAVANPVKSLRYE